MAGCVCGGAGLFEPKNLFFVVPPDGQPVPPTSALFGLEGETQTCLPPVRDGLRLDDRPRPDRSRRAAHGEPAAISRGLRYSD